MYLQSYKQLIVWQKSIDLVEKIYALAILLPKEEIFGLSSQMKRAAISIPSNIAEGQRRKDLPEFLQFLRIADASSAELETQIIISRKIYPNFNYDDIDALLGEIQKMLSVLIKKLQLKAKNSKLKACTGFTLVELLITVGIIAILAGFGTVNFFSYKQKNDISSAGQKLLAVLRDAQQKSIGQESGMQWGVHFVNSTSTDYYEVFHGASYSSGNVVSKTVLAGGLNLSDLQSGNSKDVVFSPVSGHPGTTTIITIAGPGAGAGVYEIIVKLNGNIFADFEEGIAGDWHFNEATSTTAYDSTAFGNNGTLNAGLAWQSNCLSGGCLNFDGVDDYLEFNDGAYPIQDANLENATYCFAVYPEALQSSAAGDQRLVEKRDHTISSSIVTDGRIVATLWWQLSPLVSDTFYSTYKLGYYDNGVNQWVSSNLNKWYDICVVFDGTNNSSLIYINGVLDKNYTLVNRAGRNLGGFSSSVKTQTGRYRYGVNNFFNGLMDELKIYKRVLSATEILDRYNSLK